MSLLSSIFGGQGGIAHGAGGSQPVAAPAAAPAPALQTGTNPGMVADVTQQSADTTKSPSSQLDGLKAFWDTPKDAEGKPIAPAADPLAASLFTLDPAKVQEAAGKLDFTQGISTEQVAAALGGDASALMALINKSAQNAFTAATLNTGNMVNQGVATNNDRFKATLPTHLKKVQLSQVESTNPVLAHPGAAPLVEALKNMEFSKNPNANPQDVQRKVEQYLTQFGGALVEADPVNVAAKKQATAGETDWSSFLN